MTTERDTPMMGFLASLADLRDHVMALEEMARGVRDEMVRNGWSEHAADMTGVHLLNGTMAGLLAGLGKEE